MLVNRDSKELEEQIGQLQTQIENMKRYLPSIVQGYGYKNVKEFLAEYKCELLAKLTLIPENGLFS